MSGGLPRIELLGDAALLVTFGDAMDLELNERARALAAAVGELRQRDAEARFGQPVTGYASVLVPFDPLAVDPDEARARIAGLSAEPKQSGRPEERGVIEIRVQYGGDAGPDLADVAALTDMSTSDVVDLHRAPEYSVFFLGFAPGFAYMGPLPERIATPRLATPRERVPAGSVGIAGAQTAVYPFAMPGGWRIIGRADAPMWDLTRDSPSLLRPGDRVRFVPIG